MKANLGNYVTPVELEALTVATLLTAMTKQAFPNPIQYLRTVLASRGLSRQVTRAKEVATRVEDLAKRMARELERASPEQHLQITRSYAPIFSALEKGYTNVYKKLSKNLEKVQRLYEHRISSRKFWGAEKAETALREAGAMPSPGELFHQMGLSGQMSGSTGGEGMSKLLKLLGIGALVGGGGYLVARHFRSSQPQQPSPPDISSI